MKSPSGAPSKREMSLVRYRPVLLCLWLAAILQVLYSNTNLDNRTRQPTEAGLVRDSARHLQADFRPTGAASILHAGTRVIRSIAEAALGGRAGGLVLMAEAGKKKKNQKSEVVVISVQNTPAKGQMYPVYIPSCGGGHGHGGGGYGRRKRRSVNIVNYV